MPGEELTLVGTGACIFGCSGAELTPAEIGFFERASPLGLILFARNVTEPDQVARLISAFRACVGRPDAPVLIDQEGGRVQRLGPPHWPAYPSGERYLAVANGDVPAACRWARLGARLIAEDLRTLGVTADCAPVLDVPADDADPIIGDRAYGRDPLAVARIGRAFAEGLLAGGVLPVIKHVPGHGRARGDSHLERPVVGADLVDLERDFAPFRALSDMPMAMTAHVVYAALDPERTATTSPAAIDHIRRALGFDGLLMSDDLSMRALGGAYADRARESLAAGCDVVLHCNGDLDEMTAVAEGAGEMSREARRRAAEALRRRPRAPEPLSDGEAGAFFAAMTP